VLVALSAMRVGQPHFALVACIYALVGIAMRPERLEDFHNASDDAEAMLTKMNADDSKAGWTLGSVGKSCDEVCSSSGGRVCNAAKPNTLLNDILFRDALGKASKDDFTSCTFSGTFKGEGEPSVCLTDCDTSARCYFPKKWPAPLSDCSTVNPRKGHSRLCYCEKAGGPSFKKVGDGLSCGTETSMHEGVSPADCQRKCADDANCQAYVTYRWYSLLGKPKCAIYEKNDCSITASVDDATKGNYPTIVAYSKANAKADAEAKAKADAAAKAKADAAAKADAEAKAKAETPDRHGHNCGKPCRWWEKKGGACDWCGLHEGQEQHCCRKGFDDPGCDRGVNVHQWHHSCVTVSGGVVKTMSAEQPTGAGSTRPVSTLVSVVIASFILGFA